MRSPNPAADDTKRGRVSIPLKEARKTLKIPQRARER
jgi:hypothetical protein